MELSREPSQKLSKPVPTNELAESFRSRGHISVRSVRVGLLPITSRTLGLAPKKRTATHASNISAITKCRPAGLLVFERRLSQSSKAAPITKQTHDVIESAMQSNHRMIAMRHPFAASNRARPRSRRIGYKVRRVQRVASPDSRQMAPSEFLLVVTPITCSSPNQR